MYHYLGNIIKPKTSNKENIMRNFSQGWKPEMKAASQLGNESPITVEKYNVLLYKPPQVPPGKPRPLSLESGLKRNI